MNFKKLALATAIAAVPMAGYSLEALEDEVMSEVSGQDGVRILLNLGTAGISGNLAIHDTNGLNQSASPLLGIVGVSGGTTAQDNAYSFDGAIVLTGFSYGAGQSTQTVIEIDAGANAVAGTTPILNVNITLPGTVTIATGVLTVANSQRDDAPVGTLWGTTSSSATIMDNVNIILGGVSLNIQLGNEAQTGVAALSDMIVVRGTVNTGINLTNFKLNDASVANAGSIAASTIKIKNSGGATPNDLTLGVDMDIVNAGLAIDLSGTGNVTSSTSALIDVQVAGFKVGTSSNANIGDISITGLNLAGVSMIISGK